MERRVLPLLTTLLLLSSAFALRAQQPPRDTVAEPPRRPLTLLNDATTGMHLLKDRPPSTDDLANGCRRLLLELDAQGFFFDAEYDSPCADGFSVTGFRLSPTLVYGINHKAQLRVGFNAIAFAGLDSLYLKRPVLSLVYSPAPWLRLVAGSLYGGYYHETGFPVYDPSRHIYHYQEDGLQILTNTKFWKSDTWLDWHHYLTPGTADQEQFTMGTRHEITVLETQPALSKAVANRLKITIPLHFTANHRGGQVNTISTGSPTVFNESASLRLCLRRTNQETGNTHEINAETPFYFYQANMSPFERGGYGLLPGLRYAFSHIDPTSHAGWLLGLSASRWHGDRYFNTLGSPLLFSPDAAAVHLGVNNDPGSDIVDAWYLKGSVEHEFKGLNLGLQVDCVSDGIYQPSFIFSFFMRFNERFLLLYPPPLTDSPISAHCKKRRTRCHFIAPSASNHSERQDRPSAYETK